MENAANVPQSHREWVHFEVRSEAMKQRRSVNVTPLLALSLYLYILPFPSPCRPLCQACIPPHSPLAFTRFTTCPAAKIAVVIGAVRTLPSPSPPLSSRPAN